MPGRGHVGILTTRRSMHRERWLRQKSQKTSDELAVLLEVQAANGCRYVKGALHEASKPPPGGVSGLACLLRTTGINESWP